MSSETKGKNGKEKAQTSQLGQAIRHRRKALGKTLAQVAEETQLTTGFLSQIERGISSPSLSSLMSVASALQTSLEQLLSLPEEYSEYIPKDKRHKYAIGTSGRNYEKLGPGFPGALLYSQITYRPPGQRSELMCHDGEVFFYLMSGEVEYHLGDAVFTMSAGDALHHDTSKPHYSKVLGDKQSVELWVSTTPMQNKREP